MERKIRLMTLDVGSPKDPITCHLSRVTLNTSLNYYALPYELKEELRSPNITCGDISLSITRSLATVLQALRLLASPRVLWADTVCINQDDEKEKSKQIPLMRDYYATAKSVPVWLLRNQSLRCDAANPPH